MSGSSHKRLVQEGKNIPSKESSVGWIYPAAVGFGQDAYTGAATSPSCKQRIALQIHTVARALCGINMGTSVATLVLSWRYVVCEGLRFAYFIGQLYW